MGTAAKCENANGSPFVKTIHPYKHQTFPISQGHPTDTLKREGYGFSGMVGTQMKLQLSDTDLRRPSSPVRCIFHSLRHWQQTAKAYMTPAFRD